MLLPIKWLKDYVNINKKPIEIANKLSSTGSHVESINNFAEDIEKVVVGKIVEITKHPDADKLVVCKIDVGNETLQIVTGAPNVFEGAVVPVALDGSTLANDVHIKKGELRGVESNGMLCSLEELGYAQSVIPKEARDGIYIFSSDTKIGADVKDILDLNDEVLDIEITPNRPDCLSIIGMSRETAATFDLPLIEPKIEFKNETENITDFIGETLVETKKCSRFYTKVLTDVKIEDSPQWIKNYLMLAGVRPVNNIVDLTNFVMLEYGQPLHAYDLDKLDGNIIVRDAKDGEIIKTLDEEERSLTAEDIVITDRSRVLGVAGVMGGFDSEVTKDTKRVLLEGASFEKRSIRLTSKRLGLRTEASARFEKGVDITLPKIAVNRVAALAEEIGAAKIVGGNYDTLKEEPKEKEIKLRLEKANSLIGHEFTIEEIENILNRLMIETKTVEGGLVAKVPPYRGDLEIEADLFEEVARLYGFENIEPKPLFGGLTKGDRPRFRNLEIKVKEILKAYGYSEFMSYSFISPSVFDKLNLEEGSDLLDFIKILNPLGEEYSVMRTTLISNMLEILCKNYSRSNEVCSGFEFGNTFIKQEGSLPKEVLKLCIGSYNHGDFYDLKDMIVNILWSLSIEDLKFIRTEVPYLHPGRACDLYAGEIYLGSFGEVNPIVLKNFGIKNRCLVGELNFDKIVELASDNRVYKPLPKFPAMKRDFAFVIDRDIDAGQLEEVARENGSELLEDFKVFDVYTGEGIDDDKKSIAFSLTFRAEDRTLTDQEVEKVSEKVVEEIEKQFDGKLRSGK
ncbi:MAG: phenylalanine--tRNA ligase subunit beta [Peptoniphilus duerdenii]|uniref:phenylalanine--tRNA ligase subunit beta n=1 Tax=Peptoniphilus duerdenii TaxID=507750 RepID=UPI0025502543|nr:phenylalanine--tRNA ligase subunit beta [Peptoniphilus duerdenii]MDK8277011.1 phenylalanine--tRNA ligase subunit beta [Peptoniphilus duerdenii]